MKCQGISLTVYVQNIYKENYKTLMKEIKEDLNKWVDIQVHRFCKITFKISANYLWVSTNFSKGKVKDRE